MVCRLPFEWYCVMFAFDVDSIVVYSSVFVGLGPLLLLVVRCVICVVVDWFDRWFCCCVLL